MIFSDQINEIATSLIKIQSEIKDPLKTSQGYNYTYANLFEVLTLIRPIMTKHGVFLIQGTLPTEQERGVVKIFSFLIHATGQYVGCHTTVPLEKNTPQGVGSAITYARRYAISSLLGIYADSDDDGAIHEKQQSKQDTNPYDF